MSLRGIESAIECTPMELEQIVEDVADALVRVDREEKPFKRVWVHTANHSY